MPHLGSLENAQQALQVVGPLHVQLTLSVTRNDDDDNDNMVILHGLLPAAELGGDLQAVGEEVVEVLHAVVHQVPATGHMTLQHVTRGSP